MRYRFITLTIPILTTLSTLCALPPGNPQAPADTATAGTTFRIQDYIPGAFESRLRYLVLGNGASGAADPDLSWYRVRESSSRYQPFALNWDSKQLGLRGNTRGVFSQSVHRESPKIITNSYLGIGGDLRANHTIYQDDKMNINLYGDAETREGTSSSRDALGEITYSWDRWRYSPRSWFYRINPHVHVRRSYAISDQDILATRMNYRVENEPELNYRSDEDEAKNRTYGSNSADGGIALGVGRGRVYDGTTTWRAIDLLETVAALSGRKPDDLTESDYEELAALLYELSVNKYPLQEWGRLYNYERTEKVVAQLEKSLGGESLSPKAVAAVHDILRFYPSFTRSFGKRWYIQTGSQYFLYARESREDRQAEWASTYYQADTVTGTYYRNHDVESTYIDRDEDLAYTLALVYESFQPLSSQWQLDYSARIGLKELRDANRGHRSQTGTIQYSSDDTARVINNVYRDTTGWHLQRIELSISSEIRVLYIRDSRTWWQFSGLVSAGGYQLHSPPDYPYPYSPANQVITSWKALLEGDLSYHRSLSWRLYLVAGIGYQIYFAGADYSRTDWANGAGWKGSLSSNLSLSYYF